MKRRYLMYDPAIKSFVVNKEGAIPRLLTPDEEALARYHETENPYLRKGELEIYLNCILPYA